jgi:leucyl/phenylalanyl-tRNA--protein transferase
LNLDGFFDLPSGEAYRRASLWAFDSEWVTAAEADLVVAGADLDPATLVSAYSAGLFPMPMRAGLRSTVGWFSPRRRAVIPLDGLRVSRSLRRSTRRFEVRANTCFGEVMQRCADPHRPHGWISQAFIDAYCELNQLGLAQSVECFEDGVLVGGCYGVGFDRFFAGESMFHSATDASKVALVSLVEALGVCGARLLDAQWMTPHLASLGAVEVTHLQYLDLLSEAIQPRSEVDHSQG